MKSKDLMKEIEKHPAKNQICVTERSISSIHRQGKECCMKKAADDLFEDYVNDMELSVFTNLDFETFHEAK